MIASRSNRSNMPSHLEALTNISLGDYLFINTLNLAKETNIIFLIKDLATISYVWALILHIDYKYYEHRDYE